MKIRLPNLFNRSKTVAPVPAVQTPTLASNQPPAVQINATRNADVPADKVFIENDGKYKVWSYEEPAHLTYMLDNLLDGYYCTQNFINLFYALPEVFAPVHQIAKRVSDAIFELRSSTDDSVVFTDKTFNKLFTRPNPFVSGKDFIYQAVCYEILTGKQFFYANRLETMPDEMQYINSMYNLPAHKTKMVTKQGVDPYSMTEISDMVIKYTAPSTSGNRDFSVKNVLPFLNLDLSDGLKNPNNCKSLLLACKPALKNLIAVYQARGVIYIKRGALGFIVSKKEDADGPQALTPNEQKQIRDEMNADFGLTAGKDTIGIAQAPIDFVRTSMSIEELQPFEETLADAVAIYAALRVPRHLVPSKDNSTFNNADADLKSFYGDVILPWADRYAEGFTSFFKLEQRKQYVKANYSHIPILQKDRKQTAEVEKIVGETYLQRWKAGVCSLNDWIKAINGEAGTGPLYEKKIFELDEAELLKVQSLISNFKQSNNSGNVA